MRHKKWMAPWRRGRHPMKHAELTERQLDALIKLHEILSDPTSLEAMGRTPPAKGSDQS